MLPALLLNNALKLLHKDQKKEGEAPSLCFLNTISKAVEMTALFFFLPDSKTLQIFVASICFGTKSMWRDKGSLDWRCHKHGDTAANTLAIPRSSRLQ